MRAAETHCGRAGAALRSRGLWGPAKAQLCVQLKQKHPIINPTTAPLQPTPRCLLGEGAASLLLPFLQTISALRIQKETRKGNQTKPRG